MYPAPHMNIVISLDCSPELLDAIIADIQGVLSSKGLGTESASVGNINALHCCPLAAPIEPTVCGVCNTDPCVCQSEIPAPDDSILGTDTGIVAMVNVPPINQEVHAAINAASDMADAAVASTMDVSPIESFPALGAVRILTLSTSYQIPSSVVSTANTVLKTMGRILSDGVVRFTFNGFEHALPVADANDKSIVNTAHTSGPSTVRLVIDIANKTHACLVDIEGGDKEELLIGDDLLNAIKEPVENVPAEQH